MEDLKNKVSETKKKINEAKLSQSFKDNLKIMMDKEYYKTNENSKVKLIENKNSEFKGTKLRFLYPKKVAAIFLCLIIFSSFVFAGDWENIFAKIFYNMDSSMSLAIEDGYVQNIDMDYVESNGVKIKVDYLLFDEKELYISNNVSMNEEFEEVYLKDFIVKDSNDNIILNSSDFSTIIDFKSKSRNLNKNTAVILSNFLNKDSKFDDNINAINMEIYSIIIINNETVREVIGNWNFSIKVDNENIYRENKKYEFSKDIEKYNIELKNNKLKVKIQVDESLKNNYKINKSDIYLEDENENRFYSTGKFDIEDNVLEFSIKLKEKMNIEKSKLVIKYYENEKENEIILFLKNING